VPGAVATAAAANAGAVLHPDSMLDVHELLRHSQRLTSETSTLQRALSQDPGPAGLDASTPLERAAASESSEGDASPDVRCNLAAAGYGDGAAGDKASAAQQPQALHTTPSCATHGASSPSSSSPDLAAAGSKQNDAEQGTPELWVGAAAPAQQPGVRATAAARGSARQGSPPRLRGFDNPDSAAADGLPAEPETDQRLQAWLQQHGTPQQQAAQQQQQAAAALHACATPSVASFQTGGMSPCPSDAATSEFGQPMSAAERQRLQLLEKTLKLCAGLYERRCGHDAAPRACSYGVPRDAACMV
jgi:hypothetical protein